MGLSIDEILERDEALYPTPSHPLVITHPVTGSKCLYLSQGISKRINELPENESDQLLKALWTTILEKPLTYKHTWNDGDILIWDNRRVIHHAYPSTDNSPRMLFRIGIEDTNFFN